MKKNIFQINTSNFFGGSIIPSFIIEDPNIGTVIQEHLFEYLKIHQFSNGKIILRLFNCNCCDHHERYREMFDLLERLNYINVTSHMDFDDRMEFKIKINPWYLKYIDMNPYYGYYQKDYFEFLQEVILPNLSDENQKEKLINGIKANFN